MSCTWRHQGQSTHDAEQEGGIAYLGPGAGRGGLGHVTVVVCHRFEDLPHGTDELLAGRGIQLLQWSSKPAGTGRGILPFVRLLTRGQQIDRADIDRRSELMG